MTILQGFFLGLIQGLTEFLPVSSSGHLVVVQRWLNLTKPAVLFDVTVHTGTALAIVVLMWRRLTKLSRQDLILLFLGTLPVSLVGLWLNQRIELLFGSVKLVGVAWLISALILFATRLAPKPTRTLNAPRSIFIGLWQALAIIPGISRSGSTISAGLFAGLKPLKAFEFSFLLSLPAILGAQILQLIKQGNVTGSEREVLLVGFGTAFLSGLLALKWLKSLVVNGKLHWFGLYCLAAGLTALFI